MICGETTSSVGDAGFDLSVDPSGESSAVIGVNAAEAAPKGSNAVLKAILLIESLCSSINVVASASDNRGRLVEVDMA